MLDQGSFRFISMHIADEVRGKQAAWGKLSASYTKIGKAKVKQ